MLTNVDAAGQTYQQRVLPFSLLYMLLDHDTIALPLLDIVFLDVFAAAKKLFDTAEQKEAKVFLLTFNQLVDVFQPARLWLFWEKSIQDAFAQTTPQKFLEIVALLDFLLSNLAFQDESTLNIHVPAILVTLLECAAVTFSLFSSQNGH